jgi:(2R)-sulfolactate sulfo-lyase subunit beta
MLGRARTIPKAGDALIDRVVHTADGRLAAAESLGHRAFVTTPLYCSA